MIAQRTGLPRKNFELTWTSHALGGRVPPLHGRGATPLRKSSSKDGVARTGNLIETERDNGTDDEVMNAKLLGCWLAACAVAVAGPGELDRKFMPELRAWTAPWFVTTGPDGRAWIGGGFDRADGESVGDLVRLGKNGRVADEPAPGYLGKNIGFSSGGGYAYAPIPLANGDVLLPGQSGGWLRMALSLQQMRGVSMREGYSSRTLQNCDATGRMAWRTRPFRRRDRSPRCGHWQTENG
jgi:hypothetical protein